MALVFTVSDAIAAASPGADVDAAFFAENKANIQSAAATGAGTKGVSTFAGATGQPITVATQADLLYHVDIVATADPGGDLGEVWVVNDSTTQFTVYNSGTATTAFRWRLVA